MLILLIALGCGDSESADDTTALTGCRNPDNWSCPEPSASADHTCAATCDVGEAALACNQESDFGCRVLGDGDAEDCDVPMGPTGCEICFEAVREAGCGALIEERE